MPSYEYLEMKKRHPGWIWPRSDTHMVLGIPGSLECYKTWVEPGNSFSPGIRSFGVSLWIYDRRGERWYIPEEMPLEAFKWRFKEGSLPVVESEFTAGDVKVESRLFKREEGVQTYTDTLRVFLKSPKSCSLDVYLVLRSFGACGGYLDAAALRKGDERAWLNGYPLVWPCQPADGFGAVDCSQKEQDIGEYILKHSLPGSKEAMDENGWCSGAFYYRIEEEEGAEAELAWHFPVYLPLSRASQLVKFHEPSILQPQKAQIMAEESFKRCRLQIEVPDTRFHDCFYGTLFHMLMMVTGSDVRIETSFYPAFWLRDGVYIMNALEKSGYTDMAEKAMERLIACDFAGGFGSEADALAEGIWALAEHYKFTRDRGWLSEVYPAIRRKADYIEKMMNAKEDLYDFSVEMVCSFIRSSMVCGLVCHSEKDGLIQGVMDHHIPIYWINCWAVCGLKMAAACAGAVGELKDESRYMELARKLQKNLFDYYPKDFLETPEQQGIYSFGAALWPTHAFRAEMVKEKFEEWWDTWRNKDGVYHPGFDWTYFEAAQAHNYLLLGDNEKFQIMLNRYYEYQDVPGLYGYNEGRGALERGEPTYGGQDWGFGNILPYRGWDKFTCNMPHNWVSAEVFLMLRDALFFEEEERLVIGRGIAGEWMIPGEKVTVKNAPSYFGRLSFALYFRESGIGFCIQCDGVIPEVEIDLAASGINKRLENVKKWKGELDYV